jgi:hypothetical protein
VSVMTDVQKVSSGKVFLPLLIALVGLIVWLGGQAFAAFLDHQALIAAREGQANAIQQSAAIRQRLATLAGGVTQLAQSGDPDAQSIVAQLAKSGIKFSPPTQPANTGSGK